MYPGGHFSHRRRSALALLGAFVLAFLVAPVCATAAGCAMPCCRPVVQISPAALAAATPCCTLDRSTASHSTTLVLAQTPQPIVATAALPADLDAMPRLAGRAPRDGGAAAHSRAAGRRLHLVHSVFLI
jgi:hypothetical protein